MNRRSFLKPGEQPPETHFEWPFKPLGGAPPNRRSKPAEERYAPRGRPLPDDFKFTMES